MVQIQFKRKPSGSKLDKFYKNRTHKKASQNILRCFENSLREDKD
jgi:hypothetical protein